MDITLPRHLKLEILSITADLVNRRIEEDRPCWLCYRIVDATQRVIANYGLSWDIHPTANGIIAELKEFISVNGKPPYWWNHDPNRFQTDRLSAVIEFHDHVAAQEGE